MARAGESQDDVHAGNAVKAMLDSGSNVVVTHDRAVFDEIEWRAPPHSSIGGLNSTHPAACTGMALNAPLVFKV